MLPTEEDWASVLKLALAWQMEEMQYAVITQFNLLDIPLAKKAAIGLKHHVKAWAVPALNALAQREGRPTVEDGNTLGMADVLMLFGIRERFQECKLISHTDSQCNECGVGVVIEERADHDFRDEIMRTFHMQTW